LINIKAVVLDVDKNNL